MMGALYFVAFSFIALIFQYVDIWFPDQLDFYNQYDGRGINYSIAALIILFPVYLISSWLTSKEIKNQPELREFGLRKWLIYLTLFITAIAIITGLVTLVFNFLNGELTIRFSLKVLTVFAVAGLVFWYYLQNVRDKLSHSLNKIIAIIVSIIIVVAIATGFYLVGSPFYQREVRLDNERIRDLQTIQHHITNYWTNKKELPAKLPDLTDALRGINVPTDPVTEKSYKYEIVTPLSFKLCADFNTASDKRILRPASPRSALKDSDNWQHEKGNFCFEREIDPDFFLKKEVRMQ